MPRLKLNGRPATARDRKLIKRVLSYALVSGGANIIAAGRHSESDGYATLAIDFRFRLKPTKRRT